MRGTHLRFGLGDAALRDGYPRLPRFDRGTRGLLGGHRRVVLLPRNLVVLNQFRVTPHVGGGLLVIGFGFRLPRAGIRDFCGSCLRRSFHIPQLARGICGGNRHGGARSMGRGLRVSQLRLGLLQGHLVIARVQLHQDGACFHLLIILSIDLDDRS